MGWESRKSHPSSPDRVPWVNREACFSGKLVEPISSEDGARSHNNSALFPFDAFHEAKGNAIEATDPSNRDDQGAARNAGETDAAAKRMQAPAQYVLAVLLSLTGKDQTKWRGICGLS